MRKAMFLLPALVVMWLAGNQSTQAQMWPGNSCGGGIVEMSNTTRCDHKITFFCWYLGITVTHTLILPAGAIAEACYDHTTTAPLFVEITNLNTSGTQTVFNPGYPGFINPGIAGCTKFENIVWQNDVIPGPSHVTNLWIQP